MAKKKNQNMYYILAAIIVIVVIVAVVMMQKPAEVPVEEAEEEEVVEEEPVLPEPEVPSEYAGEAEMVTSAVCADGKIGAIITNVADETVMLGSSMIFQLRGMVVKEPGCDKTELAPGESTTCTQLNGNFALVTGQNEVLVRLAGAKEGKATVTCE
jgi:hypothetical protein